MARQMFLHFVALAATVLSTSSLFAQASPRGQTALEVDLGDELADIKVEYGRPYIKHPATGQVRKIWGSLVPYGAVWRLGANEATVFTTPIEIELGGTKIPKGSYTLFMIPKEKGASQLIVNKVLGQFGAYNYNPDDDLAKIDLKKSDLKKIVDQLTIALDKVEPEEDPEVTEEKEGEKGEGKKDDRQHYELKIQWEKTQFSVPFSFAIETEEE